MDPRNTQAPTGTPAYSVKGPGGQFPFFLIALSVTGVIFLVVMQAYSTSNRQKEVQMAEDAHLETIATETSGTAAQETPLDSSVRFSDEALDATLLATKQAAKENTPAPEVIEKPAAFEAPVIALSDTTAPPVRPLTTTPAVVEDNYEEPVGWWTQPEKRETLAQDMSAHLPPAPVQTTTPAPIEATPIAPTPAPEPVVTTSAPVRELTQWEPAVQPRREEYAYQAPREQYNPQPRADHGQWQQPEAPRTWQEVPRQRQQVQEAPRAIRYTPDVRTQPTQNRQRQQYQQQSAPVQEVAGPPRAIRVPQNFYRR